jgi:hypothetical protein
VNLAGKRRIDVVSADDEDVLLDDECEEKVIIII